MNVMLEGQANMTGVMRYMSIELNKQELVIL